MMGLTWMEARLHSDTSNKHCKHCYSFPHTFNLQNHNVPADQMFIQIAEIVRIQIDVLLSKKKPKRNQVKRGEMLQTIIFHSSL